MRRTPLIFLLIATVAAPAALGDEPASPADIISLQKCPIDYSRSTMVGANHSTEIIQDCLVRPGDRVKRGQVLARLFDKDVRAQLELSKASLDASAIGMLQHEAALDVERSNLKRAELLRARNSLSVQDFQLQQLAVKTIELELKSATQSRRIAESQVRLAEVNVTAREVISPHDGVVVEVIKGAGESILNSTSNALFRVVDVARMRITGQLDVSDAWRVRQHQTVRVRPDVEGVDLDVERETFTGEVTFVDREIDAKTRTCRIFAEVDNRDGLLRAGLECNMEIIAKANSVPAPSGAELAPARRAAGPGVIPGFDGDRLKNELNPRHD